MEAELWAPVKDWEGLYEVSSLGRVRSLPRVYVIAGHVCTYGGRFISCRHGPGGYPRISLSKNNRARSDSVHRLVLLAFVGEPPPGMHACHNNGIRKDCRLSNLRWDTAKANHADKVLHGTQTLGERHPMAKLTVAQVIAIRRSNKPVQEIANDFKITRRHAAAVRLRAVWKSVAP